MLSDLRYALRQLAKSPGFTAVAVLTLAGVIAIDAQATNADSQSAKVSHLSLDDLPAVVDAQPFAEGVISTPDSGGITFSPDGKTAYFGGKTPGGPWGIMVSHCDDRQWSKPEVAPFSGKYVDGDPQMAPDGSKLFFYSRRPAEGKPKDGWWPDLWFVERAGDTWSEPRVVGAGEKGEWNPLTLRTGSPSPAADGTLYFFRCVDPAGKQVRIVRSKPVNGRYLGFEDLGQTINGQDGGFDLTVAPDQSFIIFCCSKRSDSLGETDLYISYRETDGWSEPCNLGPKVNSSAGEYSPTLSPDGKMLFFSRKGILCVPLAACAGVRTRG